MTALWGTFSQKIQRQFRTSTIAPPYAGPSMEPASAEAPTTPSASPLWPFGTKVTANAMPMGTVAPPPTAWMTLAPTIHSRLVDTATKLVPMQKTTSEA